MDKKDRSHPWESEFEEFQKLPPVPPPEELSNAIIAQVRRSLLLAPWVVFIKLGLIGLAGGAISLLFCPQFSIGHHTHGNFVSRLFVSLGPDGCMIACGATFLTFSLMLASLVLSTAELRLIRQKQFLQVPAAAFVFLALFICSGEEILLESALLWFAGGVAAGLGTLNAGYFARSLFETKKLAVPSKSH